jgi:hypothetical protein
MATRAQVAYIDEDMTQIITTYNHYDGYPESLGKALLNHYDSDEKAKDIASSGYISFLDPETGDIDATHNDPPTIIRDGDIDSLLRKFYDHSNGSGADYVYLYAGEWIDSKMYPMTQDKFVDIMTTELMSTTPMYDEEEMMEEGYEIKWKNFLNEGDEDVVGVASSILRDMPNLDVYIDSLKNDIRLHGVEDYYGYDSDDWEEDYNNYMQDKMDS